MALTIATVTLAMLLKHNAYDSKAVPVEYRGNSIIKKNIETHLLTLVREYRKKQAKAPETLKDDARVHRVFARIDEVRVL